MVTDTISDMLTRIRNATMVKHQIVKLPYTKMSSEIARILKEEGFIEDIREHEEDPERYFVISLKYNGELREPVIKKIKRISKPGLRVYSGSDKLPQILGSLGIAIISTSKGVMTNFKARELGIGGEILCYIW